MKYRGRGRPKSTHQGADLGTPELQYYKKHHLTEEVIDRYLRHNILDSNQHWCGIHLRWLYTKLYGLPTARAVAFIEKGRSCLEENAAQLKDMHDQYHYASQLLLKENLHKTVLDVTVFNRDILFDSMHYQRANPQNPKYNLKSNLINGMNILVKCWCS